jgi:hypothetical protein
MGERTADVDGTSAEEHKRAMPGKMRHAMISKARPAPPAAPDPVPYPLPVMTGPLSGTPPGEGGTPAGTGGLVGCMGRSLSRADTAPGAGKTFRAAALTVAPAGWPRSALPPPAPVAGTLPPGAPTLFGVPADAVPGSEGYPVPEDDAVPVLSDSAEPVPWDRLGPVAEAGEAAVPGWVGEISPVTAVVTVDVR